MVAFPARGGMLVSVLLCVARLPPPPEGAQRVARVLGLVAADVGMRLAGTLPRVIAASADVGLVADQVARLGEAGVLAFAVDPAQVPEDAERVVARTLQPGPSALLVEDRAGGLHRVALEAVTLVQRGERVATSSETVKHQERRFSLGRAVLTSGLSVTKKVEREQTVSTTSREPFLVLQRDDGGPQIMLYERRLDYRFLEAPQPSSFQNLERTLALLQAWLPRATIDARLRRPGFIAGPLAALPNGVDVALELVRVAHQLGA